MYSRCVHCCHDLGRNEVVEPFPVGSRLAFDARRGRLWVVCPGCSRWNLTPLEERWEAVEECERLFREQRLRAQTENIGFARARDGTGLVRIGQPLRPEFAAWRYGREFSRRRTRALVWLGVAGVAVTGAAVGSAVLTAGMFVPHLGLLAFNASRALLHGPREFELPRGPGRAWTISGDGTMILPDAQDGWRLAVRHHFGRQEYRGAEARRLLASLLVKVNRSGGSESLVRSAVAKVEAQPGDALLRELAAFAAGEAAADVERQRVYERDHFDEVPRPRNAAGLSRLPAVQRLALEMSLHEDSEQRALEGDLAELEVAWREAEEIAGIADDLLLPPGTQEFLDRHRPPRS